jgi:hypothetical protein
MKLTRKIFACVLSLATLSVHAQSIPNGGIAQGQVWTVQQWMNAFQVKADAVGGVLTSPTETGGFYSGATITNGILDTPITTNITGSVQCLQVSSLGVISGTGSSCGSGGGGSSAFASLTSGTNTSASMVIGTGGSLSITGSGINSANQLNGSPLGSYFASPPAIGTTSPAAGAFTTLSASSTLTTAITGSTQCLQVNSAGIVAGTGSTCGSGSSSGTVNSGTSGQLAYYSATGTAVSGQTTLISSQMPALTGDVTNSSGSLATTVGKVNGGVVPTSAAVLASNSLAQPIALTLGGNLAVSGGTALVTSQLIDAQTGTSFAIPSSDLSKLITFNNSSAVAVSIAQAGTTGFTVGFSVDLQNIGAGTVTVTPATSTINGHATLTMPQNTGCTVTSDGTNYQVSACSAVGSAAGSSFSTLTSGTNSAASMILTTGASLATSGTATVTLAPTMTANTANDGIELEASTAATSGNQYYSPSLHFEGQGYATSPAASQAVDWLEYVLPNQGFTNPSSTFYFCVSANGASYTCPIYYSSAGTVNATDFAVAGNTAPNTGIFKPASGTLGIAANAITVGTWTSGTAGLVSATPIYTGATTATISGCGTAASIAGPGTAGKFTVGTGASTCTFVVTINGATGMAANTGWVLNMDDTTAHLHCTNDGYTTTTVTGFCNSTVTTGDTIVFSVVPM